MFSKNEIYPHIPEKVRLVSARVALAFQVGEHPGEDLNRLNQELQNHPPSVRENLMDEFRQAGHVDEKFGY